MVSSSVPATSPTAPARSASGQHALLRRVADDDALVGAGRGRAVDDRDVQPRRPQVGGQLVTEAAVAAHHPTAVRGQLAPLRQHGTRSGLEPGEQLVRGGRVQRQPQVVPETVERVHHRGRAEGLHPLADRGRDRPGHDRQLRPQQRGRHGDRQVGVVVVGERQHTRAVGVAESGDPEVVGVGGVGGETRDVGVVRLQLERVDALAGLVDHHDLLAQRVERLDQQLTGPAVTGQQQERLPDPRHLGGEPLQGDRVPERVVL